MARIAGIPEAVIERSKEILNNLEGEEFDEVGRPRLARSRKKNNQTDVLQLSLFGVQDRRLRKWIQEMDISSMTPLEALIELNKIKTHLDENEI